jgi:transcriptional regulator with XRE-family HTH domain
MRQGTLGAAVGLSFQMVQRYEIGSNSVPASRLFEVAKALDVSPSFFFEGSRLKAKAPVYTQETIKLVRAYFAINNPTLRQSIAETIRSIATAPLSHRRGSRTPRRADLGRSVTAGRRPKYPGCWPSKASGFPVIRNGI